jgi:hypothetical protein
MSIPLSCLQAIGLIVGQSVAAVTASRAAEGLYLPKPHFSAKRFGSMGKTMYLCSDKPILFTLNRMLMEHKKAKLCERSSTINPSLFGRVSSLIS